MNNTSRLIDENSQGSIVTFHEWKPASLTFALGDGSFSIKATETGFDVDVPEDVTMTQVAEAFIVALRDQLKELKL